MQIVSFRDSFHEMSNPVFWEKKTKQTKKTPKKPQKTQYFNMSSGENFSQYDNL